MQKQFTVLILTSILLLLVMLSRVPVVNPYFSRLPQLNEISALYIDPDAVWHSDTVDCKAKGNHPVECTKTPSMNNIGQRMTSDQTEKAIDLYSEKGHNFILTRFNDSTTRGIDSDRDVNLQLAKSPVGTSAPSMSVALLLFGIGIVGFAGIRR